MLQPGPHFYIDRNAPPSGNEWRLNIGGDPVSSQLADQTGRQRVEITARDGELFATFQDEGEGPTTIPVAWMDGRFEPRAPDIQPTDRVRQA
jgi:hypothetical protein